MMALFAIISLVTGVFIGYFFKNQELLIFLSSNSHFILYILMFFVGVSVGANRDVFYSLKSHHIKIFIIPFGIIVASILGGVFCGLILGLNIFESMAVASSLGWYSLSGVMMTELGYPEMGAIAFLSSLMREILSFVFIPFIAKYLNNYTTIAPAAATSEDTTLPAILKYGGADTAIMAIFNGIICSISVPLLISFFINLRG